VPSVNPEILRWARETAGLSPSEAAKKIALDDTKKLSAEERIAALESGQAIPSRSLLSRMAKQYRRPLVAFYLASPPKKGDRGQDFRTLPDEHENGDEILLDALLRDVHARQRIIRAALEDDDSVAPLEFIGSLKTSAGVAATVNVLQAALGLSRAEFRAARTTENAFKLLREKVESLGVFVILAGNLGSHHSSLNLETFRGIAISDALAPFIVLNDDDSRAAWSFSLLHELTHLFLGQTGVIGGRPDRAIEKFCDTVAAEFLLPTEELLAAVPEMRDGSTDLADGISRLAKRWRVSRTMIAFRLFSSQVISSQDWHALRALFRQQWLAGKEKQKARAREHESGPNYYVIRRQRLGEGLLSTTTRLLASGSLSTSKVARLLAVKPTSVGALLGIEGARAAAGR
jgi:Zn-dependent peptidase ImmA (M78 family)